MDTFGRVATDLRVSLTDRCNLRCTYCMPPEGLDWLPGPELLTDDEVVRLVAVAVGLGVTEVRFTGGEPLLRRGLVDIVEPASPRSTPRPQMSLTTNGIGLATAAPALRGGRPGPGQRLAGHPRPGAVRHAGPPRPARRRAGRAGRRRRRRARPGQGQRRADARRQRRRGRAAAALVPRATATSCGSSSRCRWTPSTAGTATTMVTADEILGRPADRVRADAGRRRATRGSAPGRGVAGRRRPRPGRRHRLGDPAVLRRLRPGPAHRRRPDAQLPVRPRGDRPARRRCAPALATTSRSPRCWRVAAGASCPVTASTTRASCSRPGRCRRSAADRSARLDGRLVGGHSAYGTVWRRNPRVSRKPARCSRWSSHAVQVLRRSGACSLGLFQARTQVAGALQPLAEQTGEVVSVLTAAAASTPARRGAMPGSHGGSRPASRSLRPHLGRPTAATRRDARERVLHESVSRQPSVPVDGAPVLGRGPRRHLLDPFPAAVGEHHRHVGEHQRPDDQHPAQPAVR